MAQSEPHNPFYLLLLIAGMVFVVTALAYAVIPVLEEKAADAGNPPPPSPLRDALRAHGWKWILCEVGAIFLFGTLSMVLDRLRSLKKERLERTIRAEDRPPANPS